MQAIHEFISKLGKRDAAQRNEGTQRATADNPGQEQDGHARVNVKDRVGQAHAVADPLDNSMINVRNAHAPLLDQASLKTIYAYTAFATRHRLFGRVKAA